MNLEDISTQLLYVTLPITVKKNDGGGEFGTGFFINYQRENDSNSTIPLLVTNWHVVKNAKTINLQICSADGESKPKNTDPIFLS